MKRKRNLAYFTLITIALIIVFNLGHSIVNTYHNNTRMGKLQRDIQQSAQEIESLKTDIAYQQSAAFIEEQARNKLNFINPEEKTVVLGKSDKDKSIATTETADNPGSNWEKWRYLFFRF
ncbi:septum formation initiator family protein [Patescibacteria group bacterium]|nr:septum formation initiator family protein [Patescibacteria group bacterium]